MLKAVISLFILWLAWELLVSVLVIKTLKKKGIIWGNTFANSKGEE